ncbi:hypothetical protein [Leucobacter sp. USHLN153]|uniref:hypothetical protein n=1 Tax=Leucobacter sp. USHLN153 TaxID=3081268 RepID=UPI0030163416
MTIVHARTPMRALGIVVMTAAAALPLCLAGCSSAPEPSASASELRAAPDSGLLAMPVNRTYDVAEINLNAPLAASVLGAALDDQISSSGHLIVNDGMITAAELTVNFSDLPEASFVQTRPTLIKHQSEGETLQSVGTLTVGGVAQPNAVVELTPTEWGEDEAQFDVTFAVPDNVMAPSTLMPFDEISAHLLLVAQ